MTKNQETENQESENQKAAPQGLVMGFDFGTKKIGVAVGQGLTGSATPVAIITARDGIPSWDEIEALIKTWGPELLVVGLPLNMDDSPSPISVRAEKFARRLTGRFNIPHQTVDERLSSHAAKIRSGRKQLVDAVAAQLILETYFQGVM
jgi:putative Holliday junction resolvase